MFNSLEPMRNQCGTITVHYVMPTTLTLKNIPDDVYLRLKEQAKMHRRSLNREVIVCLETVLTPTKVPGRLLEATTINV